MTTKLRRQSKIKELVQKHQIASHEELLEYLAKEDIEITQATLSRDFAAMGIIKTITEKGMKYSVSADETGRDIVKIIGFEVLGIEHNESVVMIRTLAGRAQGVAHFIDRTHIPEIMGTLGGDDTVLIIPKSVKDIKKIVQQIGNYLTEDT
ncbi:MAG: arginine repressor [Bacteroidetes bacterium]|nr:arginine repressor [Bacteroidota bacterium]